MVSAYFCLIVLIVTRYLEVWMLIVRVFSLLAYRWRWLVHWICLSCWNNDYTISFLPSIFPGEIIQAYITLNLKITWTAFLSVSKDVNLQQIIANLAIPSVTTLQDWNSEGVISNIPVNFLCTHRMMFQLWTIGLLVGSIIHVPSKGCSKKNYFLTLNIVFFSLFTKKRLWLLHFYFLQWRVVEKSRWQHRCSQRNNGVIFWQ